MTATISPSVVDEIERDHVPGMPSILADHSASARLIGVSMDLLHTIAEVLDIGAVFPRVSAIVGNVLPHDGLELLLQEEGDRFRVEARSSREFPERQPCQMNDDAEFQIVGDLQTAWLSRCDAPEFRQRLLDAGYRSALSVRSAAADQVVRLGVFSKRPNAYSHDDVAPARHIADHLAVAVAHARLATAGREQAEARGRCDRLDERIVAAIDASPGGRVPLGRSDAWQAVMRRAMQVAATDTTVFLQGESGTGKEVMARFIHRASPRKDGPFAAINCAALPEQLLESELFGYERGAFTGAQQSKAGQIELASKGVLFLDEVSEMSPAAQAKFLRFLQEREFQRLGGTRLLRANVRVIAASNRDLRQAVDQGTFRADLFYRLQVFDIVLPPLRERPSDVWLLADDILQDLGRTLGRPLAGLTMTAREALAAHTWPGNVRELRNVLERAAILCDGAPITRRHLALYEQAPPAPIADLHAAERRTIAEVLRAVDWNKSKAARRLGLTRTQLYVRLRKYALENHDAA